MLRWRKLDVLFSGNCWIGVIVRLCVRPSDGNSCHFDTPASAFFSSPARGNSWEMSLLVLDEALLSLWWSHGVVISAWGSEDYSFKNIQKRLVLKSVGVEFGRLWVFISQLTKKQWCWQLDAVVDGSAVNACCTVKVHMFLGTHQRPKVYQWCHETKVWAVPPHVWLSHPET